MTAYFDDIKTSVDALNDRKSNHTNEMADHLVPLYIECVNFNPKLIVELGIGNVPQAWNSIKIFENVCKTTNAKLVSCDSHMLGKNATMWKDWNLVKEDDIKFSRRFIEYCKEKNLPQKIDILFIDTDHIYKHTKEEIAAWFPHLNKRCKVIFHDTNIKSTYKRIDGSLGYINEDFINMIDNGVYNAVTDYLGYKFDSDETFTKCIGRWIVKHNPYCCGLTIMDRYERKIGIVLRNKDKNDMTIKCINSILQTNYSGITHIVIIDTSNDTKNTESLKKLQNDNIKVIHVEDTNYCKNNNIGMKHCVENGCGIVMVLNNDTYRFSDGYFDEICKVFDSDENVGLVGSSVLQENGSPRWDGSDIEMFGFYRNTPDCGWFVSKKVIDKVGYLDEDFIRYFEDLDYILRVRKAGFVDKFTNKCSYIHIGGGTVSRSGHTFQYYRPRAMWIFINKWCKDKSNEWKEKEANKVLQTNYKYLSDKKNVKWIEEGVNDGKNYSM